MTVFYLITIFLLVIAWAITNPEDALDLITNLRSQFHRNIIQRVGNQATQELAQQLRTEARQIGIPTKVADQIIDEENEMITKRLGSKYTRELLDN
jgi:DNA-binding GntR family transcriptional regulator